MKPVSGFGALSIRMAKCRFLLWISWAKLEGADGSERVILVNWSGSVFATKDAILVKIVERSGAAKEIILNVILKIGFAP